MQVPRRQPFFRRLKSSSCKYVLCRVHIVRAAVHRFHSCPFCSPFRLTWSPLAVIFLLQDPSLSSLRCQLNFHSFVEQPPHHVSNCTSSISAKVKILNSQSTSCFYSLVSSFRRRSKSLGDLKTKRVPANVTPLPLDCKDELHQYSDASAPTTPVVSFTLEHPTKSCPSLSKVPRRRHSSSHCESGNKECVRLATIYGWRLDTECDHDGR